MLIFMLILTVIAEQQYLTFEEFKTKYGKKYNSTEEETFRKRIFQNNINDLKANPCEACGVTKFFDKTQDQFKTRTHLELPPEQNRVSDLLPSPKIFFGKVSAPRWIDWRQRNMVTSIKDQGDCGACWSFATAALMESSTLLKGWDQLSQSHEPDFSEQFLLECTQSSSCRGGYLQVSIDKASQLGLPSQAQYPYDYQSTHEGICKQSDLKKVTVGKRRSYYDIDDDQIMELLVDGPVAIAISSQNWNKYSKGIFGCTSNAKIDHAVLLVGYTSDSWIVKNQWGTNWGDNGYIYITRQKNKNCFIGSSVHLYAECLLLALSTFLIVFAM